MKISTVDPVETKYDESYQRPIKVIQNVLRKWAYNTDESDIM